MQRQHREPLLAARLLARRERQQRVHRCRCRLLRLGRRRRAQPLHELGGALLARGAREDATAVGRRRRRRVEQVLELARLVRAVRVATDLRRAVEGAQRVARVGARAAGRAQRGAALHQSLVEVAGALAAAGLDELLREPPRELAIGAESGLLGGGADRAQPRQHAQHVAVDDRRGDARRDRRDRARRVPADALDAQQAVDGSRELATVLVHHLPAALVQKPCAPVEAEPGPFCVDVLLGRRRERLDGREGLHPREPVRNDGLDAGLLAHDLGDPYAVRRDRLRSLRRLRRTRRRRRRSRRGGAVDAGGRAIVGRRVAAPR